ncbi:MAG: hypothetical protein ACK5PS_03300 [Desulfopila sp.]
MEQNLKKAPDAQVFFADHSHGSLSGLWRDQPLILAFLRHLG